MLALPEVGEQAAIASFLDRESAKIDALISEQEKLIVLLAEKRQATISHAVTKGLDSDALMNDSNVAWMGEVPAHWHIAKLGLYATIENGTTPSRAAPEYWDGGDIPWLASGEVNQLKITEASEFITAAALKNCSLRLLPAGTVVVGMIGQGKTRGMSAILNIPATINQNLAAICPGSRIEGMYILYLLHAVYEWLREAGRGGNQAAMNCEILAALRIPLPPLTEQRVIVDFIEVETAKLDLLRAHAEHAVALLKERRSALIAAAVTGQIDVRGAMAQNAVESPEAIAA
jgi:type I restriction enzyme S subunit